MSATEHKKHAPTQIAFAVLSLSDTRTLEKDVSGDLLCQLIKQAGYQIHSRQLLPNKEKTIKNALEELIKEDNVDVILATGGTGLGPKDFTANIVSSLLQKPLPGFGELFRMLSYQEIGAASMLSRAVGGACAKTLLFSLPGSSKAVRLAMEKILLPEIGHLLGELRGRRKHK